jgi:hypothetical protein
VDQQQKQTIFDPAKVVAVGIASPLATLLTSRFGIAGTLLGLAISSVILTVLVDALKVYLARASTKVVKVPSGLRTGFSHKGTRGRLRALFSKVSSLPPRSLSPKKRHSILVGSLIAAGVSFLVGLAVVTGVEAGVGKSLSCWVWKNCPAPSSTSSDEGSTSRTSTLPSILGGGQGAISNSPSEQEVVSPSSPQNQQPGAASPPEETPGAETPTPSSSAQPGQRQGPSGPVDEDQQQTPSESSGENQQQQQSPPDTSSSQNQQQSSSNNSEGTPSTGKDGSNSSPASDQKPSLQDAYQVPWTT